MTIFHLLLEVCLVFDGEKASRGKTSLQPYIAITKKAFVSIPLLQVMQHVTFIQ